MKMGLRKKIVFLLILAFFLMPICMSGGVIAEEQANLQESKFVEIASVHVNYDKVNGMVKNGSKVSIEVVLSNFSKEVEGKKSDLIFYSDLEEPVWGISIDGSPEKCRSPFMIDHRKVTEARITVTGKAPEVKKRTEEKVILMNITQKIKEEYPVICIKEYITSEVIEDALRAWHKAEGEIKKANWTIVNATEAGINVEAAKTSLDLAKEHLNNSLECYNAGRPEDALEEARRASEYAKISEEKAESAACSVKSRNYGIIAAVVIIAVVVFVFLIKKRRKKRGIY
ncbi:hypothetical protein DRN97_04110 [Methanosarcinales archaeon]|nr:MAG: hypothetical protein DRN97_04110 [Methanosarcinales archaeon]